MNRFVRQTIEHIGFTNQALWACLLLAATAAWLAVRIFLDHGRLRRRLSVAIPMLPATLALLVLLLDWPRIRESFAFNRPGYLAFLAVLPLVAWLSVRSLAGLGPVRQCLAILLRCLVLALVIAALADMQLVRRADRLAVIFAVDYSRSIPQERELAAREYVDQLLQRYKPPDDLAGVIYFAGDSHLEQPPQPYIELREPEAEYDRYHTDLAGALKLAQAAFPENTMKRVVLISDGNQNRGDVLQQAVMCKANDVAVDVLPIRYRYEREVQVEKVSVPQGVQQGETINLNVVLRASAPITGTLRLFQEADRRSTLLAEQAVKLQRGVNAFQIPYKIQEPNFYTFRAIFDPDDLSQDQLAANNQAESFTYVQGTARVLLIEGTPGEHDRLVQALRREQIEVDVAGPDQLPVSLAELRPYHTVILANIAREEFTQRQMEMIAANTHDLGAGLIMIGGPNSFGAGGYIDTPIEKALPVDMEIKSLKVTGKGALVLIMHACEIPRGNFWEKKVCKDAIRTLSYHDEAGVVQSNGRPYWIFPLQQVKDKKRVLARIDRLTPMDMMAFDPTLIAARNALTKSDAMTKHIILTSDGDPQPPSRQVVNSLRAAKITVTTVAVAVHGNDPNARRVMANLATATGGRFYNVRNNKMLPKIFQKEARRISRPLIYERKQGWLPKLEIPTEPVAGFTSVRMPPIRGLVLTTPKESELVQVPLTSPLPKGLRNPLLAHWVYGLGKAVAFTSDAGTKWTTLWTGWEHYRRFWAQLVRWSMRSVETGTVRLSTQLTDGKIKIVADALDKDNQFINFARIRGTVLGPDMQRRPVQLQQVAPGRYEATIDAGDQPGTHFITLQADLPTATGPQQTMAVTGVSVPYPAEFRELESHDGLLESVASITGGAVIEPRHLARLMPGKNPFRHDLKPPPAMQELWHLLALAAVLLFFFDVAVRRIALDLSRLRPALAAAWNYLRGRPVEEPAAEYMAKLRTRKAALDQELDRARAERRFQPTPEAEPAPTPLEEPTPPPPTTKAKPEVAPEKPTEPEESYTSRLLKAKKKVWEQKRDG